jgi:hypothetical protein
MAGTVVFSGEPGRQKFYVNLSEFDRCMFRSCGMGGAAPLHAAAGTASDAAGGSPLARRRRAAPSHAALSSPWAASGTRPYTAFIACLSAARIVSGRSSDSPDTVTFRPPSNRISARPFRPEASPLSVFSRTAAAAWSRVSFSATTRSASATCSSGRSSCES